MAPAQRSVLITGCSEGGMGFFVAQEFARRGWRTFATVRTPSKAGDLQSTPNVEVLSLDVISPESIAACVREITQRTGGKLDCLYNNSGAGMAMPISDVDIAIAKALFEVNVWGLLAITNALLPLLVASGGLVANSGSVRAIQLQPYDGIYGMSKAAAEMLSEQMRLEFEPLGVRVLTMHIGGVDTQIYNNQLTHVNFALPSNSYFKPVERTVEAISKGEKRPEWGVMAADEFARRIVTRIETGKGGETWKGGASSFVAFVVGWLPRWVSWRLAKIGSDFDLLAKHIKAKSTRDEK